MKRRLGKLALVAASTLTADQVAYGLGYAVGYAAERTKPARARFMTRFDKGRLDAEARVVEDRLIELNREPIGEPEPQA